MNDIFPGAKLMQVVEWGYPKGSLRTLDRAKAYSVVHITANLATAENEAAWRIRDTALQNSATFFTNRDGAPVQLLGDPYRMDPWANGDVRSPDTSNSRITAMVRDGVNANERTLVAIENVGNEIAWGSVPGGHPITVAQEATSARIIAHYHSKAGVPINRETVIGHYQLNSVTRRNCPSQNKAILDRIVALAQRYANQEDDMQYWKPVQEDWWTANGTKFWDGNGIEKQFTTRERVRSIAESADGLASLYRLLRYGNEILVAPRAGLTPIAGTRIPSPGSYGWPPAPKPEVVEVIKEVPTGISTEDVAAAVEAERERVALVESTAVRTRIRNS